jgi:hypothetical protein
LAVQVAADLAHLTGYKDGFVKLCIGDSTPIVDNQRAFNVVEQRRRQALDQTNARVVIGSPRKVWDVLMALDAIPNSGKKKQPSKDSRSSGPQQPSKPTTSRSTKSTRPNDHELGAKALKVLESLQYCVLDEVHAHNGFTVQEP